MYVCMYVKPLVFVTLKGPVRTYGSEIWLWVNENLLRSSDRNVLRKIIGQVVENGCRRRRENSEIYKFDDERDVVHFIKFGRLRRAGQVTRM